MKHIAIIRLLLALGTGCRTQTGQIVGTWECTNVHSDTANELAGRFLRWTMVFHADGSLDSSLAYESGERVDAGEDIGHYSVRGNQLFFPDWTNPTPFRIEKDKLILTLGAYRQGEYVVTNLYFYRK